MKKFQTPYNLNPIKPEVNNKPSMTLPDQTLTIQEILKRYATGRPLGGTNAMPQYEEDYDETDTDMLPDPRTLDLAEREAMAKEAKETIETIKGKAERKKAEIKAKKAAEAKEAERKKWLEEQKSTNQS